MFSTFPSLPSITLTPNEQRLCDLLVGAADWIDHNPLEVDALRMTDEQGQWVGRERGNEPVELRIAGGWVRDKLLGRESDDIDVSTSPDPITGLKFAMLFEKYLTTLSQRDLMGRLTTIEAKPEQSKHLETATARVCDLSVDWVQQRGQEVYTAGSRIPTVAFGSPLEDAQRRDLTINALFYNLRTRTIEDQTTHGLSDLGLVPSPDGTVRRMIRTPLEPFQTFKDDPLRVVRAVRFAARFGREFELEGGMVEAIQRAEIRQALLDPKKISRERVGAELDKMLLGRDPRYAFELIERLNLHPLVFLYDHSATFLTSPVSPPVSPDPSASAPEAAPVPPLPDTSLCVTAATVLTSLLSSSSPASSSSSSLPALHPLLALHVVPLPPPLSAISPPPTYPSFTPLPIPSPFSASSPDALESSIYPPTLKRLFLSCGLLPLYPLLTIEKKGKAPSWVGEKVVREGVKGPTVDIMFTKRCREAWEVLGGGSEGAVRRFGSAESGEKEEDRADIGMLLRHPSVHDGQHQKWNVSLVWSLVVDLVLSGGADDSTQAATLVNEYNRFVSRIVEYELDKRAFNPPLLDGKAINTLFPSSKSSPSMPQIMSLVLRFQLSHPLATREDVEAYMTSPEVARKVEELVEEAKSKVAAAKVVKEKGKKKQRVEK
ncbi:hypothetical protein JCM8547_002286 [Rhodosporidiobolus lusitaniae]